MQQCVVGGCGGRTSKKTNISQKSLLIKTVFLSSLTSMQAEKKRMGDFKHVNTFLVRKKWRIEFNSKLVVSVAFCC